MRHVKRYPTVRASMPGFTLIEMLMTMALLAIMLAIAAPSFVAFQRSSELSSAANSFVAAISAARAEAQKSNRNAFVVPNASNNWATGWTVFVDVNNSGTFDSTDVQVAEYPALPAAVGIVPAAAPAGFQNADGVYVLFNGAGFPRLKSGGGFPPTTALDFTSYAQTRRVVVSVAGRLRVCNPDKDAGCSTAD